MAIGLEAAVGLGEDSVVALGEGEAEAASVAEADATGLVEASGVAAAEAAGVAELVELAGACGEDKAPGETEACGTAALRTSFSSTPVLRSKLRLAVSTVSSNVTPKKIHPR